MNPDYRFGAGWSAKRTEDARLITGAGVFCDDHTAPGELHVAFLRSPHAHATIRAIDVSGALAMKGVTRAYTGADLIAAGIGAIPHAGQAFMKGPDGAPMQNPPRFGLAHQTVRFVGEPVVAVVALSRAQAIEALDAIDVDYETHDCVVDVAAALEPGAAVVWPATKDNVAAVMRYGDAEAVKIAFDKAGHRVSLDIRHQRLIPAAMEPRATFASFDRKMNRLTLRIGTQNPTTTRNVLAEAILKIPATDIRVLVSDLGGGFGMKAGVYPEDVVVAFAARDLGKPIRWRADRIEEFLGGTHGRDQVTRAELALDDKGHILALRIDALGNIGAYVSQAGALIPLLLGPLVATGVYRVPLIDIRVRGILTHTAPTGAYRGAGRPEAIHTIERLMDHAARQTGIAPATLRRRNMIPPSAMPFKTPIGEVYDSGQFAQMMDLALEKADAKGFAKRKAASKRAGKLRGLGLASYIEWTGGKALGETVTTTVTGAGRIVVHSATQAMGQGLATSYAQLAAAHFGVPIETIDVVQGDTDLVQGFGSLGSRSLFVGGSAVAEGAISTIAKARDLAADALETAAGDIVYGDGRFTVAGTDRSIGLFELAARQTDGTITLKTQTQVGNASWPNGAHVSEVEIDPDTGVVRLVRHVTADDVGTAVNPMIVYGQIHGGIAQGVGQALLEGAVYEPASGQLLTASYMDYTAPRADDLPSFENELVDGVPCLTNPLGAKGAGESGTVGAPPAVVNAVIDALAQFGVTHLDMPLTPEKVWRAIRGIDKRS